MVPCEQGLFNQIAASRRDRHSTDSPEVTYFVPVRPGQRRRYGNSGTCCGGTGMESHTRYQDSIYFRTVDGSSLYVNLYIPSTLRWPETGFSIRQDTRYPEEGSATFTVEGREPLDISLRVPDWVRNGYTVRINGEPQDVDAVPGQYVTLSRRWRPGDVVDVSMPMGFRVERAPDDPSIQSIFYGPTLLVVENPPTGEGLEEGLLPVSFYRHMRLDGDISRAMTPGERPLFFRTHGHTLAPFFVADPQEGQTRPYHMYVRRREPHIVFGSIDTGLANPADGNGLTFLDAVWEAAPFQGHAEFVATVERVAGEWADAGRLSPGTRRSIVDAARRAEPDPRV